MTHEKHPRPGDPPRWAVRLLGTLSRQTDKDSMLHDLEVEFADRIKTHGFKRAVTWYRWQTVRAIPEILFIATAWKLMMLHNYIKITLRTIRRYKAFSFIHIAGLSLGIACSILVLLYITDELSFDRFHENKDRIVRITSEREIRNEWYFSPNAPWPTGKVLKDQFPEIEDYTIVTGSLTPCVVRIGDEVFRAKGETVAHDSFLDIFSFPLSAGDPGTALDDPNSVVLTESFAMRCFGTTNVLGKTLNVREADRNITGILIDPPHNSHLQFEFLIPIQWYLDKEPWYREMMEESWRGMGASTYLLLNASTDIDALDKKIEQIVREYDPENTMKLSLQPLERIYLHSSGLMEEHDAEEMEDQVIGDIRQLRVLSMAAAGLLLIACINFMNLTTAVAGRRSREIGIRKTFGSKKKDLIFQFMSESMSLSFLSLFIGIMLSAALLPVFNQYTGKALHFSEFFHLKMLLGMLGITLLTGMISGIYPAFVLSSFKPAQVFQRRSGSGKHLLLFIRRGLVVFQFSVAILIIICTTTVARQFKSIKSGFSDFELENKITVIDWSFARHHEVVKRDMLASPHILGVSQSSAAPGSGFRKSSDVRWTGKNPEDEVILFRGPVDHEYAEFYSIQILEGRFFSKSFRSDSAHYVVNETAARMMGLDSPVGKALSFNGNEGRIIGLMEDRHTASFRYTIHPIIVQLDGDTPRFNIQIDSPENLRSVLDHLNHIRQRYPNFRPVTHWFSEDRAQKYFIREFRLNLILTVVTIMTLIIACLGLVGLSLFQAAQRTKEIGIRKVLGGSVTGIMTMLTGSFLRWVLAANLVAWPAAYLLMRRWLQNYVYRVNMSPFVFVTAGLMAAAAALLTVGYQTAKAARANPVESLKYE